MGARFISKLILYLVISVFQFLCFSPYNWADNPQFQKIAGVKTIEESRPSFDQEFYISENNEAKFNLLIKTPGKINATATWSGTAINLALILNGPGQVGYYARRDGPSPLTLEFEITRDLLAAGENWSLRIVNFQKGKSATGKISITLPEASYLLSESGLEKADKEIELVNRDVKIDQQIQIKPKIEVSKPKPRQEELKIAMPSVKVLYPNGGEVWEAGKTYEIRWTSQNIGDYVNITFLSADKSGKDIIITRVRNTGLYFYTVPESLTGEDSRIIRVSSKSTKDETWVQDESDAPFIIMGRAEGERDEPVLTSLKTFAIEIDGKYLKYGERDVGINLVWSNQPAFEWRFYADNDFGPIEPGRPIGLYNIANRNFVVYGSRRWGINLVWTDGRGRDPKDWKIEIGELKGRIWLKNLTQEKNRANPYLVYGLRRSGINLDWGSKPALPNIKIVFPEQSAQDLDIDKQFGQMDQALNVYYGDKLEKIVQQGRAHNWLVRKAFDLLKLEDVEEKYIHYGLAFADSPWFGLPETFSDKNPGGSIVAGVRDDLRNVRPVDAKDTLEVKYYFNHGVGRENKPNIFLGARFVLSYVIGSVRALYAMDNFSHYANDTPIKADGYKCSDVIVQNRKDNKKGWAIGADQYAMDLYKLALRFWPENDLERDPSLNQLSKIDQDILIKNTCGKDDSELGMALTTYLGGNPFILTKEGGPTWPIWVPDNPDNLREKLIQNKPPRSKRASAIYLGWALHMIHDLCMPYHAVNMTGLRHSGWEKTVDKFIKEGAYDHLPVWGTGKYKYSEKSVYNPWLPFTLLDRKIRCAYFSDREFRERLSYIIKESKEAYKNISGDSIDLLEKKINFYNTGRAILVTQGVIRNLEEQIREAERKALPTFEYLLDIALKETYAMIACLRYRGAGFRGSVTDERGAGVDWALLSFISEDGSVFQTGSEQGNYAIVLPKLGKYSLVVEHKDYPKYEPKGYFILEEGGFRLLNIKIPKIQFKTGIAGHVVYSNNRPLQGAEVCAVKAEDLSKKCTRTDTAGYFNLGLGPGKYSIVVTHPNFKTVQSQVEVKNDYVTINFKLEYR